MYPHHTDSIQNVTDYFQRDPEVLALLLGGSIAHGFEMETSDVDIVIVVSEDDYRRRLAANQVHFFNMDLCTYQGGYVDGKYTSLSFIERVCEKGSEPARFAFAGSRILFSKMDELAETLQQVAQYPTTEKSQRIQRFYAQFEAWHWYCQEALRLRNEYLLETSISKFILFSGRLILAHNELLYPYHKWFLRVLEGAAEKPAGLLESIHQLTVMHIAENIEALYEKVKTFQPWITGEFNWPTQFMFDSELNWMDGHTPIDDV